MTLNVPMNIVHLPKLIILEIIHRFVNGSEFLLQAHDDAELQQWVSALKAQCQTASGSEGRSQTLPASSHQPKDETKKKSFFTLKKK